MSDDLRHLVDSAGAYLAACQGVNLSWPADAEPEPADWDTFHEARREFLDALGPEVFCARDLDVAAILLLRFLRLFADYDRLSRENDKLRVELSRATVAEVKAIVAGEEAGR